MAPAGWVGRYVVWLQQRAPAPSMLAMSTTAMVGQPVARLHTKQKQGHCRKAARAIYILQPPLFAVCWPASAAHEAHGPPSSITDARVFLLGAIHGPCLYLPRAMCPRAATVSYSALVSFKPAGQRSRAGGVLHASVQPQELPFTHLGP